MDIRHLRYFIAIFRGKVPVGGIAQAGCGTAVAVTACHQAGRRTRRVADAAFDARDRLTEDGLRLVHHARSICASLDQCLSEMRDASGAVRGPVVLGLPPSVSMVLSVPLAETVRVELPQVRLQATEAMSGFIRGWIADQTVDLGFLYDIDPADRFNVTHLLDEGLCFFAPPDDWPLSTPPGARLRSPIWRGWN